jgi:hypothetical protein
LCHPTNIREDIIKSVAYRNQQVKFHQRKRKFRKIAKCFFEELRILSFFKLNQDELGNKNGLIAAKTSAIITAPITYREW